ncbi:MAG: hypothetical protein ABFD49_11190 [Armatimonadota bacterium]|nr:hypothetical protein [bacterium]
MIRLKVPANIGGDIKPAGALVTGLTSEQEKLYVNAGTAEYPTSSDPQPEKPAAAKPLKRCTTDELITIGEEIGIDLSDCTTNAERVAAIEAAQKTSEDADASQSREELTKLDKEQLSIVAVELGIAPDDLSDEELVEAILKANTAKTSEDGSTSQGDSSDAASQTFGRSGTPLA